MRAAAPVADRGAAPAAPVRARVGILTFHYSINLGAIAQTYALARLIGSWGHDVQVIDYRPIAVVLNRMGVSPRGLLRPHRLVASAASYLSKQRDRRAFLDAHVPLSARSFSTRSALTRDYPRCDVYIVGSDQVWNPTIHHYFDRSYLFDFVPDGSATLASYAASFGGVDRAEQLPSDFARLLRRLDHVSVRERSGAELVRSLTGRDVPVVLDPTLLGVDDPPSDVAPDDAYIAVYSLGTTRNMVELAAAARAHTGLRVVSLGTGVPSADEQIAPLDPAQWIAWLRNARLVLTNSFHGVALSIACHRPFLTLPSELKQIRPRFGRITGLLADLDLSDRHVRATGEAAVAAALRKPIDYHRVDGLLAGLRQRSYDYLKSVLA